MRSKGLPHRQAYNMQTAVTEQQIILAAEISLDAPDSGTWNRRSITRSLTYPVTGSPRSQRRSWVTPAIGTRVRSRRSRSVGLRCWSRPTARPATENVPAPPGRGRIATDTAVFRGTPTPANNHALSESGQSAAVRPSGKRSHCLCSHPLGHRSGSAVCLLADSGRVIGKWTAPGLDDTSCLV